MNCFINTDNWYFKKWKTSGHKNTAKKAGKLFGNSYFWQYLPNLHHLAPLVRRAEIQQKKQRSASLCRAALQRKLAFIRRRKENSKWISGIIVASHTGTRESRKITWALPTLPFQKGGKGGGGAFCYNSVIDHFMVYQHRIETHLLQQFTQQENSEWFSIISVIIFEVNIVAE